MKTAHEHIETELDGHVLWVWLNRPEASNAYSDSMVVDLPSVIEAANRDSQVRVIVLAARGKNFCAGGDVKAMKDHTGMFAGEANELRERYMFGIQQIPLALSRLSKPVIAMVQGAAVGAGCDLVAMCDLRVASTEASFAETFAKVGLVPGDGGAWFLIRAVGHSKASEMFFTGKTYKASEAQQMGLIHETVSSDQLISHTKKLAEQLASLPPIALQLTKKSIQHAYESPLNLHLDLVASFQAITQRSSDHHKAVEGLLSKKTMSFDHK
ncbi:MAG: enoyl-CoA hydratase/isomerase family protein [Bacteriovoracaceae bacterium]|nr:enoyl-CoA hydratase/isomerase family protein [Bacteriovoracaceae bacterium]